MLNSDSTKAKIPGTDHSGLSGFSTAVSKRFLWSDMVIVCGPDLNRLMFLGLFNHS